MIKPNLNEKEIEFIKEIKRAYHKRSEIKDIVNHRFYSENIKVQGEFVQIVDGILMDKFDFHDQVSNSMISYEIGTSIAYGEINYLTKRLRESKKFKKSNKQILDFDILSKELRELPPDFRLKYILIPIDKKYYMKFYEEFGDKNNSIKHDKGKTILTINNQEVTILWSNKYMPFKEIYFVGENAIDWIVKTTGQQKQVHNKEGVFSSFKDEDKEIDVFYKEKDEDNIYFGSRVVAFASIRSKYVRIYKPESNQ